MSLENDLTEIRGVGEATAESIVEVVEESDTGVDGETIAEIDRLIRQRKLRQARRKLRGL